MKIFRFSLPLLVFSLLTACAIADLRPDDAPLTDEARGRQLLEASVLAMGLDRLAETQVYSARANFDWATGWSLMPMNALPGNKGNDIRFRFATNTFDGQVEFLEGPREGRTFGLQGWRAYELDGAPTAIGGAEKITNKRYPWGLATYHYLLESPTRLLGADLIRYAGTTTFDGQTYDRVFVTWGDGTKVKKYDQWLVYINRATQFVDLTEVTITDFFLPMPNGMKNASVRFPRRERTSIGAYLPTEVVIQFGRPKENIERDVYTFTLSEYRFDAFAREELYPLEGVPFYGDSKAAR